jgi:hypothetical protein
MYVKQGSHSHWPQERAGNWCVHGVWLRFTHYSGVSLAVPEHWVFSLKKSRTRSALAPLDGITLLLSTNSQRTERVCMPKHINGDAFSDEIKQKAIDIIRADMGKVDLVIYSFASPRRQHPKTGVIHGSVLKPIGQAVTQRGVNTDKQIVEEVTLPAGQRRRNCQHRGGNGRRRLADVDRSAACCRCAGRRRADYCLHLSG